MIEISSKFIDLDQGVRIHYRIAGEGETILFLHGWPTSSYLWRNILTELSDQFRVIAIDLPGFGQSDKRPEDSYSFRYYQRVLTELLERLEINQLTLGVHDLGGPIGLYWMMHNMEKVDRLILLNTLVYPKFSNAVKLFYLSTLTPGVNNWLSSPKGVGWVMKFGVHQKEKLTDEIIQNYQSPFQEKPARKALLKSIQRLSIKAYEDLSTNLPSFKKPVQILYGEKDRILPKVADTMAKVKRALPQAQLTSYPDCGHFLQEEIPVELASKIRGFMQENP